MTAYSIPYYTLAMRFLNNVSFQKTSIIIIIIIIEIVLEANTI